MPASVFRADYDQLNEVAKLFEEQANVAQGFLRDITQQKQRLQDGDWIGEAGAKFYQRMDDEVLPELKRLVDAMHLSSQVAKAVSGLVKQLEQDTSGIFNKGAQGLASALAGAGIAGALGGALGSALGNLARGLAGGSGISAGRQDALDKYSDQLQAVRATLGGGGNGSSSGLIPSQEIMDAVRQDLSSQGQMAENGWKQAAASGGGSGGGSGSGSGAPGGAPATTPPAEQPKSGGGGGGGGGSPSGGGGSMGAGANSQVGGAQGMVGAAAGGGRGGGGMFGGGDSIASLGAAVMSGVTRAAGGAAPIAEVVLMVGASAGGLLFASKGSGGAAGWAAGQLSQSASSPILRGARG